jgi:DNA polymerase-3 subunit delta
VTKAVYLVKGSDPGLIGRALKELLERLAGGGDADDGVTGTSAHVEEYWPEAGGGDPSSDGGGEGRAGGSSARFNVAPILEALETPAFLYDRRVIVVRRAGALDAQQAKRLAAYLADPLPCSTLVLVADDKSTSAGLDKAVKAAGEVIDVSTPSNAGGRRTWIDGELRRAGVTLDKDARSLLDATIGEDVSSLPNILANVAGAYGDCAKVTAAQLEPFLGESGSVAPWALTDAIDAGDMAGAIDALSRLSSAGERHPLAILPSLHRHFGGMLALDGLTIDESGAARLLGMSPFPAGKLLRQGRRLGTERIESAVLLLADADLDLRGRTELSSEAVMEILVGRLARLSGEVRTAGTTRSRSSGTGGRSPRTARTR